jgi:hypothetical protein
MGRRLLFAALALTLAIALPAPARADVYDDNPAAASRGDGDMWVFTRRSSDGAILERHLSAGQWTDWASLGGATSSGPAAVGYGDSIHLFVTGADNAVWTRVLTGSTWSEWQSLGGFATSAPSASVRRGAVNYLDLTVRGADSALWHRALIPGSGWSGFASVGGILTSGPASISQSRDMLNIFVRATDGSVAQKPWTGSAWLDWVGVGGGIVGAPAAVSRAEDDLDVYVRGAYNRVYQNHWDPRGWSGWLLPGGDTTAVGSSPAAVSDRPDREVLFARGGEGLVYKVWDAARGWDPWQSFGPVAVPVAPVPPPPPLPGELDLETGLRCTPPNGKLRVSIKVRKPKGKKRARVSKIVFFTRGKGRRTRVDRKSPFVVRIGINKAAGETGRVYARIYYRRSAKGKLHRKTVSRRYVVCA